MRASSTMKASAGVKLSSRIRVTILDRPSFIPGMGTGFGIALSNIKMVSATTVKTDRVESLFRFMSKLLFATAYRQLSISIHNKHMGL